MFLTSENATKVIAILILAVWIYFRYIRSKTTGFGQPGVKKVPEDALDREEDYRLDDRSDEWHA